MIKDTMDTVRAIAQMGCEVVEFCGLYHAWTPEFVRDVLQSDGRHGHSLQLDAQ